MPGAGIRSESDGPVVLETAGRSHFAQKGTPLRYTVIDLSLLCGRTELSLDRATKEVMVRAVLSELEFDSVQLNRKDAVVTLRAVHARKARLGLWLV